MRIDTAGCGGVLRCGPDRCESRSVRAGSIVAFSPASPGARHSLSWSAHLFAALRAHRVPTRLDNNFGRSIYSVVDPVC